VVIVLSNLSGYILVVFVCMCVSGNLIEVLRYAPLTTRVTSGYVSVMLFLYLSVVLFC